MSHFPSIDLVEKIVHVAEVETLGQHRLRVRFEDGLVGELDFSRESWKGVSSPLADAPYFDSVRVDEQLGTIVWPNGADIAPETLYRWVLEGAGPT